MWIDNWVGWDGMKDVGYICGDEVIECVLQGVLEDGSRSECVLLQVERNESCVCVSVHVCVCEGKPVVDSE